MTDAWAAFLAAIVAASGAVAGSILERWRRRAQDEARTEQITVDTAEHVVALLRQELDHERFERRAMQRELVAAHEEIRSLRRQVAELQADVAALSPPMPGG